MKIKLTVLLLVTQSVWLGSCGDGGSEDPLDVGPVIGLDVRPSNLSCIAPERPAGQADIDSLTVQDGTDIDSPSKLLQRPGSVTRWYVLQLYGQVKTFDVADPLNVAIYLDLSPDVTGVGNGGLLSMAFHPDFPNIPELFVYYTSGTEPALQTVLSRITLDDVDSPIAPVQEILLTIDQATIFHHGGDLVFGQDGYLYVSVGESGARDNAQDTTTLLGSILRLDVAGTGYEIPVDNPFAGNAKCGPGSNADSCPELFAWGFRNPFRLSFDGAGRLWEGEPGKDSWEEINHIEKAGNYGWPCREGAHDFEPEKCAPSDLLVDPVYEYSHDNGDASITGGYVYTGTDIAKLQGKYIFGDFISGRIWSLDSGNNVEELVDTPFRITSFGQSSDGEIYFTDWDTDSVNQLVATTGGVDTIPLNLVDTGCVDQNDPTEPVAGIIPYSINAAFWSDNASKTRLMGVPDGSIIDVLENDDWDLPAGSVLVKNFSLNGRLIETRLLMRHPDGSWAGYTYEWNDSETQATRIIGGSRKLIDGQEWIYPSEAECMVCHTSAAGFSLGLETAQLNRQMTYPPPDGNGEADQLATLNHILLFSAPMPDSSVLPSLADPSDVLESLSDRARAWLHTNCSQCHRPDGVTQATIDLRYTTSLADTGTCNVAPIDDLGIANALLIVPGDAARSIVVERIGRRDNAAMPPLGSNLVDQAGLVLVSTWIDNLNNCFE